MPPAAFTIGCTTASSKKHDSFPALGILSVGRGSLLFEETVFILQKRGQFKNSFGIFELPPIRFLGSAKSLALFSLLIQGVPVTDLIRPSQSSSFLPV